MFASIWFRSLYDTSWRSVRRCSLYAAAILVATVPLWTLIPEHTEKAAAEPLIGTIPLIFVTLIVARELGRGLMSREQGLRRDATVAATSAQLLGVTDPATIQTITWTALTDICATTPGLRLLKAVRDGRVLRVVGDIGDFSAVPATLPLATAIPPDPAAASSVYEVATHAADRAALDAAIGAPIEWVCLSLTEQDPVSWLFIGMPKKIPSEAVLVIRSVVNQSSLALRNSYAHQELTVLARFDSLTGLANRAWFNADLSALQASSDELHVLFLDLDDFKDVNDILGHRAGDDLLVEVAARLRRCTRPEDVCARLGGDEFAVVLRGVSAARAADIAQRIVDSIGEPIHISGHVARVGVSVGLATGLPGLDIEELVHQADVAMYAAKAHGKDRIQVFNEELLKADTFRMERKLATAIIVGGHDVGFTSTFIACLTRARCQNGLGASVTGRATTGLEVVHRRKARGADEQLAIGPGRAMAVIAGRRG